MCLCSPGEVLKSDQEASRRGYVCVELGVTGQLGHGVGETFPVHLFF